jgi:hypothetical protein
MWRVEGFVVEVWFIACVLVGPLFIAIGARAAGLAVLSAAAGAFIGMLGAAHPEDLAFRIEDGATVGVFVGGLAGLAWGTPSRSSATVLRVLGLVTIFVGVLCVLAEKIEAQQRCGAISCMRDFDDGSLVLFAFDVMWVAALFFIQAAQSNLVSSPTVDAYENPELPAS